MIRAAPRRPRREFTQVAADPRPSYDRTPRSLRSRNAGNDIEAGKVDQLTITVLVAVSPPFTVATSVSWRCCFATVASTL